MVARGLLVAPGGGDGDGVAFLDGELGGRAQGLRRGAAGVEAGGVLAGAGQAAHVLGYGWADGERIELLAFAGVGGGIRFQGGGVGADLPGAVGQAQDAQVVLEGELALVAGGRLACRVLGDEAQHAPFGVGEEAQGILLVLVGAEVVGAPGGLAGLVDELSYLLPGGGVVEDDAVGPGAEADLLGQAQVVVGDAGEALVAVGRHTAVGMVVVFLGPVSALLLEVAGQGGGRTGVARRAGELVGELFKERCGLNQATHFR